MPVSGTDGAGSTKTDTHQISTIGSPSATPTFDANGNMTSDGTNTYEWDAENRLIKINYPGSGKNSLFEYDSNGSNVRIVETVGGSTISTAQFVNCGGSRCERRDAVGNVAAKFFSAGEIIGSGTYLFTMDHLGSVRESIYSGLVQEQFQYDLFGQLTNNDSIQNGDFGFAGYYFHKPSGLSLPIYRAYNSSTGRWFNRDPIGEFGDINLFCYAQNNPVSLVDPSGLDVVVLLKPNSLGGIGHCAVLVGRDGNPREGGGWNFYESGQLPEQQVNYPRLEYFYQDPNRKDYSRKNSAWFPRAPFEDRAANAQARNDLRKDYDFFRHNCADICRNAAIAAGIDMGPKEWPASTPRGVFNAAKAAGGKSPK